MQEAFRDGKRFGVLGAERIERGTMNELNIVPIWIVTTLFCIMSYWHGRSEYGWKIVGLLINIMLGFVFAYLAVKMPIFL